MYDTHHYLITSVHLPTVVQIVKATREKPYLGLKLKLDQREISQMTHFSGTSAGPLTLVMIAFGVDPMTGRATALAAGHGFLAGWSFALAGDMLYFAVIALTTLRLNSYFRDPNTTMLVVLGAMFVVPVLVRYFRSTQAPLKQ